MNFCYKKYITILFVIFSFILANSNLIFADRFTTKAGGKIEGEHLNNNEYPYRTYKIKHTDNVEIEIDAKYIARKISDNPISPLAEYNSFAPFAEDNVENHLKTAEWCRKNNLPELNKLHLNIVLEKDTDNKTARQLLGYFKDLSGNWTTPAQRQIDLGMIQTSKGWRTQQQIEVDKIIESRRNAENRWQKEIQSLLRSLPANAQARSTILSIHAPEAAPAIAKALAVEHDPDIRILLIRALSNIGTSATIQEIARWSINQTETVTSVKRVCFDELRKHKEFYPILIGLYASQLKPQYGVYAINAAALAIAELEGKSAIPQLIEVLVTVHVESQTSQPAGMISNNNTTGLQWGQPKEIRVTREIQNTGVLKALCLLTGMNFQFDKNAWKRWLIQSRRSQYFDARRSE